MISPRRKEPLAERAYHILKKRIITLEYPPGLKLDEKELIRDTGIGRTPVREALKMLISEGLVVSYGTNSTYVKDLTIKSAKDLKAMLFYLGDLIFNLANPNDDFVKDLEVLESIAERMEELIRKGEYFEFVQLNSCFHRSFAGIAKNEILDAIIERVYNEEMRLTYILSSDRMNPEELGSYYTKVKAQHKEFIGCLRKKDFEGLKSLYKTHFREGNARLMNYFNK
jgi:DNA-binding GntR family transcriptional regulator